MHSKPLTIDFNAHFPHRFPITFFPTEYAQNKKIKSQLMTPGQAEITKSHTRFHRAASMKTRNYTRFYCVKVEWITYHNQRLDVLKEFGGIHENCWQRARPTLLFDQLIRTSLGKYYRDTTVGWCAVVQWRACGWARWADEFIKSNRP